MTSQLLLQPSTRDDFIVGNDLTSLLAASADDVQTVLKHLGSVRRFKFCFHLRRIPTCRCSGDSDICMHPLPKTFGAGRILFSGGSLRE